MTAVAAIVLAAGASTRYRAGGGSRETKLVDLVEGTALVRRVVRAACEAGVAPVVVVTGHARAAVEAVLDDLPVRFVDNPAFADGLSFSLRAGLRALTPEVSAAVILLGDMPYVTAGTVAALVAAASAHPEADAVVPVAAGVRGNPVLLRKNLFAAACALSGDEGARRLLRDPAIAVLEVVMEGTAVRDDLDEAGDFRFDGAGTATAPMRWSKDKPRDRGSA